MRAPGKLSPRVSRKRCTASDCSKQARSRAQELLVAVPPKNLRLGVEDIVGPHVEIVLVQNVAARSGKIVQRWIGKCGPCWNQLKEILCLRRQPAGGNYVAWELSAVRNPYRSGLSACQHESAMCRVRCLIRVVNRPAQIAQVPAPFCRVRDPITSCPSHMSPLPLVISEDEDFILDDRGTQ